MKKYLLDSSFVIDSLNEAAAGREGPAFLWLKRNPRARLWISPVTLAEVLEGAVDVGAVTAHLARYSWQGIHRVHAEVAARRQRGSHRRMGENDAWQCAVAERMGAVVVGHDAAFRALGAAYEDFRQSRTASV